MNNYIIYHAHTSLESVITYDGLGRCFRFVYIYACIVVCFCVATVIVGKEKRGHLQPCAESSSSATAEPTVPTRPAVDVSRLQGPGLRLSAGVKRL